jgi:hypothetical protein
MVLHGIRLAVLDDAHDPYTYPTKFGKFSYILNTSGETPASCAEDSVIMEVDQDGVVVKEFDLKFCLLKMPRQLSISLIDVCFDSFAKKVD